MKLKPGDPLFVDFDGTIPFVSVLPSSELLRGANVSPFFAALAGSNKASEDAVNFVFSQAENALNIARRALQWDAINIGVRSVEVAALGDVFLSIWELGSDDKRTVYDYLKFANTALDAVWQLIDAALSTFASIPIIGIIFQAAKMIITGINIILGQIKSEKDKGRKLAPDAVAYERGLDEDVVRSIISASRSRDWTPLFMPFSLAEWQIRSVSHTKNGVSDGRAFGPVGLEDYSGAENLLGLGCFPQMAEQFATWQYARRYAGQDNRWRFTSGFTQWHPSAVQASVTLWQRVMDYSPRMFSVNMWAVESAWGEFFANGFELSKRLLTGWKGIGQDSAAALAVAEACAFDFLAPSRGGSAYSNKYSKYNYKTLPDKYLTPAMGEFNEPISYGELIRYIRAEIWHPRARASMKTILCAYVDDSSKFPGMRAADPKLKELWLDMRKELLKHSAVHSVENDLIPDEEYRSAVIQSKRSFKELTLNPQPSPEPKPGSPWQRLDLSLVVEPDEPPDPPSGLEPGVEGDSEPSGGGALAVMAAAAAGLFAFAR